MAQFEEITALTPAYDRRDPDPARNYGVHGVELRMVLKGAEGAVQFVVHTNWMLPSVSREGWPQAMLDPLPADLGYHSPVPRYEGQTPMGSERVDHERYAAVLEGPDRDIGIPSFVPTGTFTPCPYLDGRPCYYDGSTLAADKVFQILLRRGSKGVWRYLRRYYRSVFEA